MVNEPGKSFSRKDQEWTRLAVALQKQGCAVLTFDFRGFGENRNGRDSLPETFWKVAANAKVLLPKLKKSGGRFGAPSTLDGTQFPADYLPWLVQDIVAARCFLDIKHDERVLNSQNLIVIGAGEGGTLAAYWLAGECSRQKTSLLRLMAKPQPPFESRDLVAAVWLDPVATVWKTSFLKAADAMRKQSLLDKKTPLPPMLFVHGKKATNAETRNLTWANSLGKGVARVAGIEGAEATGQGLLRERETEKVVLVFLAEVMKKRKTRDWSSREFRESYYIWHLGGKNYSAKQLLLTVPMPLPLDTLGFKLLPAY
jgi:hypothetical protein